MKKIKQDSQDNQSDIVLKHYKLIAIVSLNLLFFPIGKNLFSDEIVQGFKSPAFSGVGTSSNNTNYFIR